MRLILIAAAILGPSSAAAATLAPAATPRITDAAVVVDYAPELGGQFLALGLAPISDAPGLAPFDLQIDGALVDPGFAPVLTVTDAGGGALLSGEMTRFSVGPDGALSLLFDVTADALGLFGPRVLAIIQLGLGADPLAAGFTGTGAATVAPAVAPIPVPAPALLLLGGLAMLASGALRRGDAGGPGARADAVVTA